MMKLLLSSLTMLSLAATLVACGGNKPATSAASEPAAGSAAPAPAATPASTPAIGPDQCCCPFASAEDIQYNVMTKADCDAAGTGCVEDARCTSP